MWVRAIDSANPSGLLRAAAEPGLAVAGQGTPGAVIAIDRDGVHVAAQDGAVVIRELQAAGRKRMAAQQFAAGRAIAIGRGL